MISASRTSTIVISVAAAVALWFRPGMTNAAGQEGPRIERLDPALDRLIAPDARIETVAEGYDWSEGPVWVKDGAYLLFSDIPQNVVYRWKEGEGAKEYLKPSGYTSPRPHGGEIGSGRRGRT